MTLQDRITADLTAALKAKDAPRLEVLRFVKSAMQNARIAKQADLTDADVEKTIAGDVKRRTEAAEQFRAGNRPELAEADEAAMAILQTYLPQVLSAAELEAIVGEQIAAVGAKTPADFGKVMGPVMAKVGTRADGKAVQALVKKLLTP
ncbi:MAG: GatB/YqeY domain-containing protein [Patescibacteria group bacterium]